MIFFFEIWRFIYQILTWVFYVFSTEMCQNRSFLILRGQFGSFFDILTHTKVTEYPLENYTILSLNQHMKDVHNVNKSYKKKKEKNLFLFRVLVLWVNNRVSQNIAFLENKIVLTRFCIRNNSLNTMALIFMQSKQIPSHEMRKGNNWNRKCEKIIYDERFWHIFVENA